MIAASKALARRWIGRVAGTSLAQAIQASPAVTGKIMPMANLDGVFTIPRQQRIEEVPPEELWEGYAADAERYLASGAADVAVMLQVLGKQSAGIPAVVLDLGCAAGRMIRHFPRREDSEHWGMDVNAHHIAWCQQHLPSINFAVNSTAPHLPFADAYFDLVYCGSVFTHISDLADAWLLELRRILKPGGMAYLTLHDLASYEAIFTTYADDPLFKPFLEQVKAFEKKYRVRDEPLAAFSFGVDPLSQVFYDRDYITAKWSKWMRVLSYDGQVHDHQSAILLQKR